MKLYAVVDRMAHELEKSLIGEDADPEKIREISLEVSRRFLAFRVGKAVCYAISKKLVDDWNDDDLDRATSPESLSMAADDYKQDLPSARKRAKEQLKINEINTALAA